MISTGRDEMFPPHKLIITPPARVLTNKAEGSLLSSNSNSLNCLSDEFLIFSIADGLSSTATNKHCSMAVTISSPKVLKSRYLGNMFNMFEFSRHLTADSGN